MAQESVKGSILLGSVVTVRRLRDAGRISAEDLEVRLSAEALELIDAKIGITQWYPIHAFCELLDVDWEICGKRVPEYMERQGAVSADRMFDLGMYQQLDYAERAERVESIGALVSRSRLISSVTGTFYNFLEFDVAANEDCLDIIYRNARAFEQPLIHTTVGFMNQINARQNSKRRFSGERIGPDEVRFRMPLSQRFAEPR